MSIYETVITHEQASPIYRVVLARRSATGTRLHYVIEVRRAAANIVERGTGVIKFKGAEKFVGYCYTKAAGEEMSLAVQRRRMIFATQSAATFDTGSIQRKSEARGYVVESVEGGLGEHAKELGPLVPKPVQAVKVEASTARHQAYRRAVEACGALA